MGPRINSRISIIAAMSRNRVIGAENHLPWNIPEDLRYFREKTSGHPVIMGRKTHESIFRALGGKPLPKRTHIVITRGDPAGAAAGVRGSALGGAAGTIGTSGGVIVAGSLEEAVARASEDGVPGRDEIFVIGGAQVYAQALQRADRVYLTLIDREYEGDAFFPEFDWENYRVLSREHREGTPPYEFVVMERK